MSDIFDSLFKASLRTIFLPARTMTVQALSRPVGIVIGILLVIPPVLAEPHIRALVAGHVLGSCVPGNQKDAVKSLCDFVVIVLQVLIAVAVGGIAITDRAVTLTQNLAASFASRRAVALSHEERALIREMYRLYLQSRALARGITIKTVWSVLQRTIRNVRAISKLAGRRLPRFYIALMIFRFGSAFPGGFYGVIALGLFEGLLTAQVVKVYYDYALTCAP